MGDRRLSLTSALALWQGGGGPCTVRVVRATSLDGRAPLVLHELDPESGRGRLPSTPPWETSLLDGLSPVMSQPSWHLRMQVQRSEGCSQRPQQF